MGLVLNIVTKNVFSLRSFSFPSRYGLLVNADIDLAVVELESASACLTAVQS